MILVNSKILSTIVHRKYQKGNKRENREMTNQLFILMAFDDNQTTKLNYLLYFYLILSGTTDRREKRRARIRFLDNHFSEQKRKNFYKQKIYLQCLKT